MLKILVWMACIVVLLPTAAFALAVVLLAWIGLIPKKKEGKFYD